MTLDVLIQGAGLGAVVLFGVWDLYAMELAARTGRARAHEAGGESRCPFCREEFGPEGGDGRATCAACATPHHAGCWAENRGCTLFGCGAAESREALAEQEVCQLGAVTEDAPCG